MFGSEQRAGWGLPHRMASAKATNEPRISRMARMDSFESMSSASSAVLISSAISGGPLNVSPLFQRDDVDVLAIEAEAAPVGRDLARRQIG